MKKQIHALTVISVLFIVFGIISAFLCVWEIFGAAYHLYLVGFWGGFVSDFTALFKIVYASLVIAGGFMGLLRKKLDFCFKLGVLMVFLAVVQIVMEIPRYMLGAPLNILYYVQWALNIIIPVVFVKGVSSEQKRLSAIEKTKLGKDE